MRLTTIGLSMLVMVVCACGGGGGGSKSSSGVYSGRWVFDGQLSSDKCNLAPSLKIGNRFNLETQVSLEKDIVTVTAGKIVMTGRIENGTGFKVIGTSQASANCTSAYLLQGGGIADGYTSNAQFAIAVSCGGTTCPLAWGGEFFAQKTNKSAIKDETTSSMLAKIEADAARAMEAR